jgi:hypothetical protein
MNARTAVPSQNSVHLVAIELIGFCCTVRESCAQASLPSLPSFGPASERAPNSKWRSWPCATSSPLQQTAPRRLRLSRADRFLWMLLSRVWSGWRVPCRSCNPPPSFRGIVASSPGRCASAGSRHQLWTRFRSPVAEFWHRGARDRAARPVAESVRGAPDRDAEARVSRSCHRVE